MGLSWVGSSCDSGYLQVFSWICSPMCTQRAQGLEKSTTWTPQVEHHSCTAETCANCLSRPLLCLSIGPYFIKGTTKKVFIYRNSMTLILPFLWARVQQQKLLHEGIKKEKRKCQNWKCLLVDGLFPSAQRDSSACVHEQRRPSSWSHLVPDFLRFGPREL